MRWFSGEELKKIEISRHVLVPKHILLSDEEKEKIVKKYGDIKLFPRILITDPAIRHLKPKVGDLIKIVRKSVTAGETVYYRVVVSE